MGVKYGWRCVMAVAILTTAAGCKRKEADRPGQTTPVSPAEIAAVRDVMAAGMHKVAPDELTQSHVGKPCVVTAHNPASGLHIPPPPPPLGMVRRVGRTVTICKGELESLTAGGLKVRALYPSSDKYKTVEIPRADVESVHLGN